LKQLVHPSSRSTRVTCFTSLYFKISRTANPSPPPNQNVIYFFGHRHSRMHQRFMISVFIC
jgi:hypothetical protein